MEARKTDNTEETKRVEQSEDAYLLSLPNEVLGEIGSYLTTSKDQCAFSTTCNTFYPFFKPYLNEIALQRATKLGQHVVDGEQDEAKAMLEKNPGLLHIEVEVTNKATQRIKGTAYKLALGAGDPTMCRMIEPYFAKLEKGDEEKTKQTNEQFPASYDVNAYEKYDFKALLDDIAADRLINDQDDKMNEKTRKALQAFKEHFTPKPTDVITTGKHFDMRIFLDAITAYDKNFDRFHNDEQRSFYCRKSLGILQRLFPACDAQAFCQGLYNVVERGQPLVRRLKLNNGSDFFSFGLGDSHFVYSVAAEEGALPILGSWRCFPLFIEKLCQAKAADLADLTQRVQHSIHHEKPVKSRCVVS